MTMHGLTIGWETYEAENIFIFQESAIEWHIPEVFKIFSLRAALLHI